MLILQYKPLGCLTVLKNSESFLLERGLAPNQNSKWIELITMKDS